MLLGLSSSFLFPLDIIYNKDKDKDKDYKTNKNIKILL
jgi:hypothetical protein